jgi:endonuclease V-like protein UPF0215 family
MGQIRLEKRGIRALGVSESFREDGGGSSILAGVVVRSDLIVDGFIFGVATLEGDDATDTIVDMFLRLNRNDINLIMLGGAIISLYNIIDIDRVAQETDTPVICVTFEESDGLESAIRHHFPDAWKAKTEAYRRLGGRVTVELKTGYRVYIRPAGVDVGDAARAIDKFTHQGAVPEPIRLARLLARAEREASALH